MTAVSSGAERMNAIGVGGGLRVATVIAASAPVLVVFKLALSDGGRHVGSLVLAQAVIFVLLAVLIGLRMARGGVLQGVLTIMTLLVAASALWSVRPEASVREALIWSLVLGIVVIVPSALPGARAAQRVVDGVVFTAGWLCLVALFVFWGANNPGMRWYSTFYWPNPFAGFLLLTLPIEMVRCMRAERLRDAAAHGGFAVLLGTAFVLTYSRGGWLSLAAAMPLLLVLLRPRRWAVVGLRLLAIGVLVGGAVVVLTGVVVQGPRRGEVGFVMRAASVADSGDLSIRGRLEFWRAALAIFRDHPLAGTGAGTFGVMHTAYQRDPRFYAREAHSLYVQTMAELGVLGVIVLAALLVSTAVVSRRALRAAQQPEEYSLAAGCVVALAAFLIHSGVEMNWAFPANPATAMTIAGVLAWYASPSERHRPQGRGGRGIAIALLLALIAASLAAYGGQQAYASGKRKARENDWGGAADAYARAARLNPIHPAYEAIQAAAVMQGPAPDLSAARRHLERAMTLDRMNASHPLQLARLFMQHPDHGSLVRADGLVRRALGLDAWNRPEAYQLLARLAILRSVPGEAEAIYRDAVAGYAGRGLSTSMLHVLLWPEVAGLYEEWAAFLRSEGRTEEAVAALRMLLEEDPYWEPAYAELARLHIRQGRIIDAGALLLEGLERIPASEELWVMWRTLPARRPSIYER